MPRPSFPSTPLRAVLACVLLGSLAEAQNAGLSEAQILRGLEGAEREISLYARTLRNPQISARLLRAHREGVRVRVLVPSAELREPTSLSLSLSLTLPLYALDKNLPAQSFALIDRSLLMRGERVGRKPTLEQSYPTRLERRRTLIQEVNTWLDQTCIRVPPLDLKTQLGDYFRLPKRSSSVSER